MAQNYVCAVWIALLGLFALIVTPESVVAAQPQELSFTLHEQLVIGDDGEAPSEYLFAYPHIVRTDSKGNIYVKDGRRADIRVFDAHGQYLATIGKRGKGPGEMLEIFGMHVDGEDRLIIADRLSRRFTIFADLGKSITTKAIADEMSISPYPILSLHEGYLLNYVRVLANPDGGPSLRDDWFLHSYDTELNRLETFGLLADVFDMSSRFLKAYSDSPRAVRVATNGKDTIVVAPAVYDGYIVRYTRSTDGWVMDKLKGRIIADNSYMSVTKDEFDSSADIRRGAIITSDPTGSYRARVISRSRGIGILSSGQILHFPRRMPLEGQFEPLVELYGQDGILQSYGRLQLSDPELNSSAEVMESIDIKWIDTENRIYVERINSAGFVVLSVAELEVSPL